MTELQNSLLLFFTGSAHHSWNILAEQEKSTAARSSKPLEALHECSMNRGKRRSVSPQRSRIRVSIRFTNLLARMVPTAERSQALVAEAFSYCFASPFIKSACVRHLPLKACKK